MAEDLQANLSSYQLQLQQVEAALALDPDNDDLTKLKKDLDEVCELTLDLIKNQSGAAAADAVATEAYDAQESTTTDAAPSASSSSRHWNVGDACIATWSEDNNAYEACIEEILDDGSCTITFAGWGNTEVTQVSLLQPVEHGKKRSVDDDGGMMRPQTKRDKQAAEREYKRKKAQKKAQRMKQLEEEREGEKNKWLTFNAKTFSKTTKGKVKKSIFATPDSSSGRVGVGTCGKSGNPMTKFNVHEKWKK